LQFPKRLFILASQFENRNQVLILKVNPMPNKNRFPAKDGEFNVLINIIVTYLNANKARLVLTPTAQAALTLVTANVNTAVTGWNALYPLSQNPGSATNTIIAQKTTLRSSIESEIRIIFNDIPESVLLQIDRDNLNLPAPSGTHTPATKPTSVPSLTITNRGHLSISLSILDVAHSQVITNVSDADSIEIESAFLMNSATPSTDFPTDADFRHLAATGKSSYTRSYTADQLKGSDFLRARYLSSRKEPGSWSEVISVVVS
jgi:hypothetical protein